MTRGSRGRGRPGPRRGLAPVVARLTRERDLGRTRGGLDPGAVALMLLGAVHQRAMYRHRSGTGTPSVADAGRIADALLPSPVDG
ncbi:hypothetical protein GCM10010182_45690 [Actinomadura cremea]|nr:hypothetical protein GCM10010182_45690 [Actinomadura cremea]